MIMIFVFIIAMIGLLGAFLAGLYALIGGEKIYFFAIILLLSANVMAGMFLFLLVLIRIGCF